MMARDVSGVWRMRGSRLCNSLLHLCDQGGAMAEGEMLIFLRWVLCHSTRRSFQLAADPIALRQWISPMGLDGRVREERVDAASTVNPEQSWIRHILTPDLDPLINPTDSH